MFFQQVFYKPHGVLGKLPLRNVDSQISSRLNALTEAHNLGSAANLDSLSQKSDINIIPVDVNSLFNEVITAS